MSFKLNNKDYKTILEFYNKKISTEVDHSDLKLDELHELWLGILSGMGYHSDTIEEFYE